MVSEEVSKRKFEEVSADLLKELETGLDQLRELVIKDEQRKEKSLSGKWFHLEFGVVSRLYYRLQRHLIDWGTRSHHPHLNDLSVTRVVDYQGYSYKDKLIQH